MMTELFETLYEKLVHLLKGGGRHSSQAWAEEEGEGHHGRHGRHRHLPEGHHQAGEAEPDGEARPAARRSLTRRRKRTSGAATRHSAGRTSAGRLSGAGRVSTASAGAAEAGAAERAAELELAYEEGREMARIRFRKRMWGIGLIYLSWCVNVELTHLPPVTRAWRAPHPEQGELMSCLLCAAAQGCDDVDNLCLCVPLALRPLPTQRPPLSVVLALPLITAGPIACRRSSR